MTRHLRLSFLLTLALIFAASFSWALSETESTKNSAVITEKGLKVEFSIEPALVKPGEDRPIVEGEFADVKFKITDAALGTPVSPLEPAVWIDLVSEQMEDLSCNQRIQLYLQGTLNYQANIDLTKFFILVLNNDRSISVIDPILGMTGYTQLYAMAFLEAPGEDWVMSPDGKKLYVTMPTAAKVAVVDLSTFKVVNNIQAGHNPASIALQPDGHYLWVGNDGRAEDGSGITVIDLNAQKTVATIPTGAGHHRIAFSDDSLFAYVSNSLQGTLSVIDTQQLKVIEELPTGKNPVALAYSTLSRALYLASEGDGEILMVDGATHRISKRIKTESGLVDFRLDPTERWGFAANAKNNRVDILDTSNNTIVHTLEVGNQPHQFAFTEAYAYVRSLGAPEVHLIRLNQLDSGKSLSPQRIPIGTKNPDLALQPSVADAISPTGEWTAVVATNPADRYIYYYMEGMVAPMGSFQSYGRVPRAVTVVDRTISETEKGVYSARIRVPKSGDYNVAFLVDSPWVDQCFSFSAEADPALTKKIQNAPPGIEFLTQQRSLQVGRDFKLKFALKYPDGALPETRIDNIQVLMTRPPGVWQQRQKARLLDDGSFETVIKPDQSGVYYVSFAIPELNIDFTELPYISLRAKAGTMSQGARKK